MTNIYQHRKNTIPIISTIISSSTVLEYGVIPDSIKLYKLNDDNVVSEKIEGYNYDIESKTLLIPNYQFGDRFIIKYERTDERITNINDHNYLFIKF